LRGKGFYVLMWFKGMKSILGKEEKETLEVLEKTKIKGKWLNLASGDRGYNDYWLKRAEQVVSVDKDENALKILYENCSDKLRLKIMKLDITKNLPFEDNSFEGVLHWTLHLFLKEILENIFLEINKVLKEGGQIIIDFATDIKRIGKNGENIKFKGEIGYSLKEAESALKSFLPNYYTEIIQSQVRNIIQGSSPSYRFSCNFLVLRSIKLSQ